jgi:ferredoxin
MRVLVDAGSCVGHGRCYDVAPALFEDDDQGYSVVKGDGTVPAGEVDAARLAARLCPERAVRLVG